MPSSSAIEEPIVIFGGFLSFPAVYFGMRETLVEISGQSVWIVGAWTHDWLRKDTPERWTRLLHKLQRTVKEALRGSKTGKVTLIGHSAGGVISRLYLSPEPYHGHAYSGLDYVSYLITLGSPHANWRYRWTWGQVEERYPGSYFAPQIKYTSVAGKAIHGRRRGSFRERWAYRFYERLCGTGDVWGDGLVPVASQLLKGSQQIILEGMSHFKGFGGPWYGETEIIPRWWNACVDPDKATTNGSEIISQDTPF